MKITYESERDNWTEFFTEQILKAANVETQEIHVIATDESRTYIKVKIWNADAAPTIMGMAKGAWEEHTWVIKSEFEEIDATHAKMHYILFDLTSHKSYESEVSKGCQIIHMVPQFISRGEFRLVHHGDKGIEAHHVKYATE